MTEFNSIVEEQKLLLEAEEWAKGVKTVHAHSLTSLWYDTRKNDGAVLDIEFNNGVVKREIRKTGEIIFFGKALTGVELINSFVRNK